MTGQGDAHPKEGRVQATQRNASIAKARMDEESARWTEKSFPIKKASTPSIESPR